MKSSYWNEDPRHPVEDWQKEVAEGNTRLGYWAWIENMERMAKNL